MLHVWAPEAHRPQQGCWSALLAFRLKRFENRALDQLRCIRYRQKSGPQADKFQNSYENLWQERPETD